ncbi:MAG: nicotinic acid mononucleotide adenyltransferase [Arenibacter latericius]|nr:nicotinic acid mononucleotide adenyltransferase [Arenibacter latericius]
MKTIKLLSIMFLMGALVTSCYTEVIVEDDYIQEAGPNLRELVHSYELWYVDISATLGNGEVPFLQRAFTVSFRGGELYANNNLAGFGKTGNGYGIPVGFFNTANGRLNIDHDVDGLWGLEVFVVSNNTIELYDSQSDTSYFLKGYQRNNFNYDKVFYDNLQYFLQEYDLWEKVKTSSEGEINEFDDENYLQFFEDSKGSGFRSSLDPNGIALNKIIWDYQGGYEVYNLANNHLVKAVTLDYDFMGSDYFELYVINDSTVELYHTGSGTVYTFKGRGFTTYLKSSASPVSKKRVKTENATMNVSVKRKG